MKQIETYPICAGVRLHHIKTDKFKTVSVGLHIHRPLKKDEASKNALLTDVIERGNQTLKDSAAISRYLQSLYGAYFAADVRKKGEDQILSFVISTVADSYLPESESTVLKAVEMLFDMVLCPQTENGAFRSDYTEQEKRNLENDILALMNDKRSYATWRLVELLCKDDPYGVHELGSVESVRAITPESLFKHYETILTESPIDIFITGDADISAIVKMAEERFCNRVASSFEYPKTALFKPKNSLIQTEESYDVSQAKLSIGFYTGIAPSDPRYSALMVYNSIFGSGAHSKLFNHVREKLSLAYYASSRLERYKGLLLVSSGIEYENKQKAEDEIFAQVKAMQRGEISDYEFDVSVKSIVNSLRSLGDTGGYLSDYYLGQLVSGTNISLKEQCNLIEKVTKEEVISLAKEIQPEMVYTMKSRGREA